MRLWRKEHAGFAAFASDYAPGLVQPPHADGRARVSLVLAGAVEEESEAGRTAARCLDVVVKPAAARHATRFGPKGARLLTIELDGDGRLGGAGLVWLQRAPGAALALETAQAVAVGDTRGVEAGMSDLAAEALTAAAARPEPAAPAWAQALGEEIDAAPPDAPFEVGVRARRLGVHPVYLARAFKRAHGVSITEKLAARRVRAAAELIARKEAGLAEIALACGFYDQSHLCRHFRRVIGATPAAYRGLVAPAQV